jgi:hypothetical protein
LRKRALRNEAGYDRFHVHIINFDRSL